MPNAFQPREEATARREEGAASTRALMNAVGAGDAAAVASLVASGAHADSRLANGETPLMRASARGYEDVARVLLDAGADVNARRSDGFTPLVLAVFFGHESLARLLLERGADSTARTRLGTTAESWASARGFGKIAWVLRSYAPSIENVSEGKRQAGGAVAVEEHARRVAATREDVSIFSRKHLASGALAADNNGHSNGGRTSDAEDLAVVKTADVSVRRAGDVPAHPSASGWRLGAFLRSWQASVGTALLLLAVGVAVFAVWRNGQLARQNKARPAPTPQAAPTQLVSQPPAPAESVAAPQPSTLPTPDAQGGSVQPGTPGSVYVMPAPAGQPFYVPPTAAAPSNLPKEPTVISESDAPSNQNSSKTKSKSDAAAPRDASSDAPANGAGREEQGRSDAAQSGSSSRSTQDKPQTNQPARTSPPPAPASTPERGKVIQWPPQ